MSISPSLTAAQWEQLLRARDELAGAAHGTKDAVAERLASGMGCSVGTLYRRLKQAGSDTGRKRRVDAGRSMVTAHEVKLVGGMLLASANKKGQHMPLNTAVQILQSQGKLNGDVSESTIARQLRATLQHPDQMDAPKASVPLRSLHPNHVWQIDSTTGAYYYLPGGRLRWMPEDEFYKNKVANLVKASTDLLTRYAAADHTSHAFKVRYYLGGESADNLIDFCLWSMLKQEHSPMHGVPMVLMMDPGAANKSLVMRNFCKRTGVELHHHAAGAANVTGSVEKSHDLVRMHFESRLRFVDPGEVTLDLLNVEVCKWAAAYCSTAVHSRYGTNRFAKWLEIRAEQLRVFANEESAREHATREPEKRRVSNLLQIDMGKRVYDVSLVPGVAAAQNVMVAVNLFRAPAIDVLSVDRETGEETWHIVEPIEVDNNGFRLDAQVIGAGMRSARNSEVDDLRNRLTKEAYRTGEGLPSLEDAAKARKRHAQAYAGEVDVMADVKATTVPTYMPRRGTVIDGDRRNMVAQTLSHVDAAKQLKRELGEAYTPQVYGWLTQRFPDGVPEDQLGAVAAQFAAPAPAINDDTAPVTGLRVVAGGG